MLIPRRVKHRKQHHPSRKGAAKGGSVVAFGDFGIQALAPAYVTNRQIEAAALAAARAPKPASANRGPRGPRQPRAEVTTSNVSPTVNGGAPVQSPVATPVATAVVDAPVVADVVTEGGEA